MRYFIHLAYNGSAYHGWQRQENAHTVQAELEKCLSLKLGTTISLMGCGRTDTGVHAKNFFAHFDLESEVKEIDSEDFRKQLNRFLPPDIVVFRILKVPDEFHARFDAISRKYCYYLHTEKDVFNPNSYYFPHELDIEQMNEAARILLKHTDFTSFSKLHTQTQTNNCKIEFARWTKTKHHLVFEISADRFLRNMVRAIVGSLIEAGLQKRSTTDFEALILAKNRNAAGYSVPAHALFLEEVIYPAGLFEV
ncbi:MAG: tRNA pseudouridine(38-40) synthase TruA [Bacteroidales bacterium]|nr:tRNA pseudouridine(38-40) synthase TruA [Bacteroidales bacterium]